MIKIIYKYIYMNKYILSIIILLVLDILWLKLFMIEKYRGLVFNIQNSKLEGDVYYAIPAYILMVLGLLHFVLPNIKSETLFNDSIQYGALFGIVLYGVYNFTCGAVFKNWDINIALLDIFWGGFVYFATSYLTMIISKKLNYQL